MCVLQSRVFLNRLLDALRSFPSDKNKITLSHSFKKDVQWWRLFMGERKASKYFISPNQAVAVAQPNVPSQYFETI